MGDGAPRMRQHDPSLLDLARQTLAVCEAAGIPSAVLTPDGWVVEGTRTGEDVLGSPGPLVGRHVCDWLSGDELERVLRALRTAVETGQPQTVSDVHPHEGGSQVAFTAVLQPLWIDGEVVAAQLVPAPGHDREEVQQIERRFVEYLQMVDGIDAAVYRLERRPHLHFSYLNARAEEILDTTFEELAADPDLVLRRTHPEDRGMVLAGRHAPLEVEWPVRTRWSDREGNYSLIEVREIAITDSAGDVVATMGTARDLTALDIEAATLRDALHREQEAVDQLREIDELRQTFLRAVSHELRTPLTAVTGYAETLRTHIDRLSPAQLESLAERMHRNAERLRGLLDDLLDIDRMSRGTLGVDLRSMDLVEVVLPAIEAIDSRGGQVRADLQPARALVDVPKLHRVLENLVVNALKHGGDRVTVWVRTYSDEDGTAVLVVEDDGPGIPKEDRERLFEPFEQGMASAGAHSPGTGLGLTLVRELVALQGGDVRVEEGAEGGARFVLRLPSRGPS